MIKVISEIGINFRGDIGIALQLIDSASHAGCWGVKFQYRNNNTFYHSTNEIGDQIIAEEIQRNSLSFGDLDKLARYAAIKDLKFGVSFFRLEDLRTFTKNFSGTLDYIKIPSPECLNQPLLAEACSESPLVFVSIGGHTIEQFMEHCPPSAQSKIVVMHCVSNYPVALGNQRLKAISKIRKLGFEVGYSSHDSDYKVCLLAMALGATWIERHITPSKNGNGLDDSTSSEESEIRTICEYAEKFDEILSEVKQTPNQGEIINMQNLGTGLYPIRSHRRGETISIDDCLIRAPRTGISVGDFTKYFQAEPLKRALSEGEPLGLHHYREPRDPIKSEEIEFCRANEIFLPVRFHDIEKIRSIFNVGNYEFHLSFSEIQNTSLEKIQNLVKRNESYSIHLPDYIPGNRIFDPISEDHDTRSVSLKILKKTVDMSKLLSSFTGKNVAIVGSFSQTSGLKTFDFMSKLKQSVLDAYETNIYPQWLPRRAWYFGGFVAIQVFNDEQSIDAIEQLNIEICLDTCHLVLSANSAGKHHVKWLKRLLEFTRHIHISDGSGEDSEGLKLGLGDFECFGEVMTQRVPKVIETWQGHLDGYAGFKEDITYLWENFGG